MGGFFRKYPPPPWRKLLCRSGLQWVAMGELFRNYPPDWNCHVRVGCNGLQWEDFSGNTPLPPDGNCYVGVGCNGLQWENFSGINPLTEIAMLEWAAMGCNGTIFQELPPDWNCHVRVGCNGLQWEDFSGITPWLKLPCKSGLQWAAMAGLFRNYPPWLKLPCKSWLQWAAIGGLFRNYPLTEIAMLEWAAMGCNGRTFQELPPPPLTEIVM